MVKLIDQDITMRAGDTLVIKATTKDDAATPVAVDLTGASIIWSMAQKVGSPAILTKTVSSGIVITDAPGGVFQVTIDPADTAGLDGPHYHEAQITDAAGQVQTGLRGAITIERALI